MSVLALAGLCWGRIDAVKEETWMWMGWSCHVIPMNECHSHDAQSRCRCRKYAYGFTAAVSLPQCGHEAGMEPL